MQVTAVATILSAETEPQARSLGKSLQELSKLGLPVFAAERGSPPKLAKYWSNLPNFEVRIAGSTLVEQVRDAFTRAQAAGHRYVLYTEPDKREFFCEGAQHFKNPPGPTPSVAIVAARDEESFRTFPSGQQAIEHAFNLLSSTIAALHGDILYGPLALDLEHTLPYFDHIPADLGWGWRTYILARLKLAGLMVTPYEGYFPCPARQRKENEPHHRAHRLAQLEQNVRGLRLALIDVNGD